MLRSLFIRTPQPCRKVAECCWQCFYRWRSLGEGSDARGRMQCYKPVYWILFLCSNHWILPSPYRFKGLKLEAKSVLQNTSKLHWLFLLCSEISSSIQQFHGRETTIKSLVIVQCSGEYLAMLSVILSSTKLFIYNPVARATS